MEINPIVYNLNCVSIKILNNFMSGHSKWAKLKHFKGALDAKKSAIFTKLGHAITIAAREGGGNPESNFKLRLAIESARKANLPKDNIDRAIKRGTGELAGEKIEEILYEAFGPEGTGIVIQTLTDNKNRTIGALRRIFNKHGGSLGGQNSVLWMFERKGILRIENCKAKISDLEKIQLETIDLGAEDIKVEDGDLVVYAKPEDLEKIKEKFEQDGNAVDYAGVEWLAKEPVKVSQATQNKIDSIFAELDEEPDISDYYSNVE